MPLITTTAPIGPGISFQPTQPPAAIVALGTGKACIVEQFPWGPSQTLYYPSSDGDRINTFAPAGMSRLGSGYLATINKAWPQLCVIRVEGSTAVAASAVINSATPTALFTVNLKYPGTAGNAVTWATTAPSDGNAAHVNLYVTVTSATGTTQDVYTNVGSASGVVTYTAPALSYLVGSLVWTANGTPAVGSGSFSSGTDGTIAAADYVGTAGSTNKGYALLEADQTIGHKFSGDPGSSLRASVNAGMAAHANYMTCARVYINGVSGNAASAAQADAPTYQSNYAIYCWPWCSANDDTTGALQFQPSAAFVASLGAQCSPTTRLAARDPSITQFLSGIQSLEFQAGANAEANKNAGITSIIKNPKGGFTPYLDVTTNYPQNPSQGDVTTYGSAIFIAAALQNSLTSFVNGPNVPLLQQSIVGAAEQFMDGLKDQQNKDPIHNPYVLNWGWGNFASYNTPAALASGKFYMPLQYQTDAGMVQILFPTTFGPAVVVSVSTPQS